MATGTVLDSARATDSHCRRVRALHPSPQAHWGPFFL